MSGTISLTRVRVVGAAAAGVGDGDGGSGGVGDQIVVLVRESLCHADSKQMRASRVPLDECQKDRRGD
jgi:hypothetical protein